MKYRKGCDSNGDKSQKDGGDVPPSMKLDITVHPGGGGSAPFSESWTPSRRRLEAEVSAVAAALVMVGATRRRSSSRCWRSVRVAILEKAASGLGKLDFVWATVVLLGGFVGSLNITDFWCLTVILVGEGARVFSRSHELEWQHHATETSTAGGALRSSSRFFRRILHALVDHTGGSRDEQEPHQHATQTTDAGGALRSSSRFFRRVVHALAHRAADGPDVSGDASTTSARFQNQIAAVLKKRTGHAPNGVSLLPYTGQVFTSRNIGRLLNWLQVLSAFACVALSLMRLWKWKHDFGGSGNMRPALLLFYTLALLEALLFLLEKAYWAWKLSFCNLLRQVSKDCQLGAYGHVSLTRFFYDAYSRCVTGSIFDGINMDLVTFAEELILSDFLEEQLIGVRILEQFAEKVDSAGDTLRKVGTSPRSVERLVEMLNWKRPDEEEVRRSAAGVVCKLAGKRQNALRLSAIPGAIESVMSLLYRGRSAAVSGMHPQPNGAAGEGGPLPGLRDYDYLPFNLLGLRILKKLARDQDNCGKISNARGLLAKIIDFTQDSRALLRNRVRFFRSPLPGTLVFWPQIFVEICAAWATPRPSPSASLPPAASVSIPAPRPRRAPRAAPRAGATAPHCARAGQPSAAPGQPCARHRCARAPWASSSREAAMAAPAPATREADPPWPATSELRPWRRGSAPWRPPALGRGGRRRWQRRTRGWGGDGVGPHRPRGKTQHESQRNNLWCENQRPGKWPSGYASPCSSWPCMQELLDRALPLFLVRVLFIVNIHIRGSNIHALPATC